MKSVVVGDVALERHRRYVAAYLTLSGVTERVRVQGFGLPDGNLWVVGPCSLTDEQRQTAVDKVHVAMAEKVMSSYVVYRLGLSEGKPTIPWRAPLGGAPATAR